MAIDTGKVLRNGERIPWLAEYFANTVGATYAQLQLATITYNPEHCMHLSQAKDLAAPASETEGEMALPVKGCRRAAVVLPRCAAEE